MLGTAFLALLVITINTTVRQVNASNPELSEAAFSGGSARLRFGVNLSQGGPVSTLPVVHGRLAFSVSPGIEGNSSWNLLGVDVEEVVTRHGRPQLAAPGLAVRNACSALPRQGVCQFWNVFGSSDINLPLGSDLLNSGITISFWMKAGLNTFGDVFFLADNDLTNSSTAAWLNAYYDSTCPMYRVAYSALSLARGGVLTWRSVDSATGEHSTASFTDSSLVDGEWHLVNLIVGQTVLKTRIARWYVDGRGSFRAPSYQCVSGSNYQWLRAPDAAAMLAARSVGTRQGLATNITAQLPAGVFGFGLWNGSLFSLQFFPYDMTHMQVLITFGESWMTGQFPISSTFALCYAIVLGLSFLVILPIVTFQVRSDILTQLTKINYAVSHQTAAQAGGGDSDDVIGRPVTDRGEENHDENLADRATHAVSQLKGNLSSISNTLQTSRSTTSVLQQLAVILPIVLAIPQSLGMYFRSISFPGQFTDVVNKIMWIPNFDLSVSFSIPPYITLIFQFILFVVAVVFVRSLLVADWITFARSSVRFEVILESYTSLTRQHLLPVAPSEAIADQIAKVIAVSRVGSRVEMLELIRAQLQLHSVRFEPRTLLMLSRRIPLAPESALQPFIMSAASSVGLTITESDASVFSDLLLATQDDDIGKDEKISGEHSQNNLVRDELHVPVMTDAIPVTTRINQLLDVFARSAGTDDIKGALSKQNGEVSTKKDMTNEADAIACMLLDFCRQVCAKEDDRIFGCSTIAADANSSTAIWQRAKVVLSKPDMPNPESKAPRAKYTAFITSEENGSKWIVQQRDSPGWVQLMHAANTISRFSRMEQSHVIRELSVTSARDPSIRRRLPECFLMSDPKHHSLLLVIGRPRRTDEMARPENHRSGKTMNKEVNVVTPFEKPEEECFRLSVESASLHRCPRHQGSLIAAKEDRHLVLKSIDSGSGGSIYRCAHAGAHAYKRCAQELAEFSPCDVAELFVCPDDTCRFSICRTCWDAMPNALSGPRAARILLESAVAGAFYTVKHLPGGLLYVLVITILQSLSFPVMQGSVAILTCHPSIRCNFQVCDTTDTNYLVAAILSAILLAAYNFGLTGAWVYALSKRRNTIRKVLEPFAQAAGGLDSAIVLWEWFLQDDTSVLSCFYRKYEVRFVNFEPLFLLLTQGGRVIAVAATDPDSWEQLLAVGAMECVLAVYWLLTSPFVNPQLDALAKSGSCHQLLQLCWLGLYNYMLLQGSSPLYASFAMLATSFIYLVFVLVVLFQTVVAPLLKYTRLLLVQGLTRRESLYIQDDDNSRAAANLGKLLVEKEDAFRDALWKRILFGGTYHLAPRDGSSSGSNGEPATCCCFQEMLTHAHVANRLKRMNDQLDNARMHAQKAHYYFTQIFLVGRGAVDSTDRLQSVADHISMELDGIESGGMLSNEVVIHAAGGLQLAVASHTNVDTRKQNLPTTGICATLEEALLIARRLGFSIAERNLFLLLSHTQRQVCGTASQPLALTGIDLSGADLRQLTIRNCDLRFANLSRANFEETFFYGVRLGGAELHAARFISEKKAEPDVYGEHSDSIFSLSLLEALDKGGDDDDAQRLVSASGDETAIVWEDVAKGSSRPVCQATLAEHSMFVLAVACSPYGESTHIATGGADSLVFLWSASGECRGRLVGHTDEVSSLAFSPDGSLLASGAKDKAVKLWSVSEKVCVASFDHHAQSVTGVCFHPDGTLLASSSTDCTLRLWEIDEATAEGAIPTAPFLHDDDPSTTDGRKVDVKCIALKHTSPVSCVRFSPDGMTIACAFTTTLRVWKSTVRSCSMRMTREQDSWASQDCGGHTLAILSVEFSPDGLTIISGSADTTVRLWSVAGGHCLAVLQYHKKTVCGVVLSEKHAFSCGADETILRWQLSKPRSSGETSSTTLTRHTADVRALSVVPVAATDLLLSMNLPRFIVTGSDDRTVCVWNESSGQCIATSCNFPSPVYAVAIDPLRPWVIYMPGLAAGTVGVWDIRSQDAVASTLRPNEAGGVKIAGDLNAIVFSPSGNLLAVGGDAGSLCLWRRPYHQYSNDQFVSSAKDFTSELSWGLRGHTNDVLCCAFSPNSELLVSGGRDRTLRIWRTSDCSAVHWCKGHADSVRSVSWISSANDRQLFASGGGDNFVCTWSMDQDTDGITLLTRVELPDAVLCMDASPCGGWLIAGRGDGQLSVFRRQLLQESDQSSLSDQGLYVLQGCIETENNGTPHAARFIGFSEVDQLPPFVALCNSHEISLRSFSSGVDEEGCGVVSSVKWTSDSPVRFNDVHFHM